MTQNHLCRNYAERRFLEWPTSIFMCRPNLCVIRSCRQAAVYWIFPAGKFSSVNSLWTWKIKEQYLRCQIFVDLSPSFVKLDLLDVFCTSAVGSLKYVRSEECNSNTIFGPNEHIFKWMLLYSFERKGYSFFSLKTNLHSLLDQSRCNEASEYINYTGIQTELGPDKMLLGSFSWLYR